MRNALAAAALTLTALTVSAQTPVKATSEPAKVERGDSPDNREMNIRAYIQLLRTDVKKTKAQVMGDVMQLDANQAARFWPVYKDFENEFSTLGDQVVALLRTYVDNYDKMTDTVADQVATQLLNVEQQKNQLKNKYYNRMKSALDAITAARFLQIENQLERLIDLQVSAQLPVVSKQ